MLMRSVIRSPYVSRKRSNASRTGRRIIGCIDTPQGVFTGILTITEVDDMLAGTIGAAESPDQTAPLEALMFDSEMSKVTFTYDSGEFGIMNVTLTLDGDALNGIMNVTQFGAEVPMTASRKMME